MDIRCHPPTVGDACAADYKAHICECDDGNAGLPHFIGASRTYIYYSKWFADKWLYQSPTAANIAKYADPQIVQEECWSTRSIANIGGVFQGLSASITLPEFNGAVIMGSDIGQRDTRRDDVLFHNYIYNLMSEEINELSDELIKFVDGEIFKCTACAPIFLVFWLTGCGEPCVVCGYEGTTCQDGGEGPPGNGQLQAFIRGVTNYWTSIYNDTGFFAHESYPQDYYGRIYQVPEPIIGWQKYFINLCNYCGCILFCILRACRDPWATQTSFSSRVFLFNRYDGIPYRYPAPLINFALSVKDEAGLGSAPIMLDHLAEEYVWSYGYSNLYRGNIQYLHDEVGKPSDAKTYTLGHFIKNSEGISNNISSDYVNEKGVVEATFTTANPLEKQKEDTYLLTYREVLEGVDLGDKPPYAIPQENDTPPMDNFPQYIREIPVRYKHSGIATDLQALMYAGWLAVDIPEVIEANITNVGFSNDFGTLPNLYYETTNELWGPYRRDDQFFVRSVRTNGFMGQVDDVNQNPAPPEECAYHPQIYAKQFAHKSVKAPYNLYFKEGEATFRECKLFETLTNLEPGRYYFPNPYICKNHLLNWYDFSLMGGIRGTHYQVDESEGDVYKYFNTNLPMQFLGKQNEIQIADLEKRLYEAIRILGFPWENDENYPVSGGSGPIPGRSVNFYPMEDAMSRKNLPSFREVLANTIETNPCNVESLKQGMNDFFRDLFLAGYSEFSPG